MNIDRDMNIDVPVSDARRIEVVATGLPMWHGAQLAIDAKIVSPVTRTGTARPGADTRPAAPVQGRSQTQAAPNLPRASSIATPFRRLKPTVNPSARPPRDVPVLMKCC